MRYKVSGAIAIPRQAGDVPQPCRTGFGWFPKNHVSHETLLLERTVFHIRQKGVPPLLLPTSMLQLPRCLVRICNLFHKGNQIANWKVSKKCNCSRGNLLQNNLLRKCGLLAHTSAAFLKNCCTEKLSVACGSLLAVCMEKLSYSCRVPCETRRELLLEIPPKSGSARLGHIPSLPGNRNCP